MAARSAGALSAFTDVPADAFDRFVDATALAWIVPHVAPASALLMPVVRDAQPGRLLGHLPKRHPAALALARNSRAQLLLLGPHGVVTSTVAGTADWAPTWNFVSASIEADLKLDDTLTERALEATVAHLDPAWNAAALGARHAKLMARVIGFSAEIVTAHPRFKLGQDEHPEVRARIAAHFAETPLGAWMARHASA